MLLSMLLCHGSFNGLLVVPDVTRTKQSNAPSIYVELSLGTNVLNEKFRVKMKTIKTLSEVVGRKEAGGKKRE